jgi:hypothetical protein
MRKPPEIDHVGKPVAAGCESLVAAGCDGEAIADRDRVGHRKEEREPRRPGSVRVRLHLDGKTGIGARGPDKPPASEDAGRERPKAARREIEGAEHLNHRAGSVPAGSGQIDRAAGVTEFPGTAPLKDAARRLIETGGKPAKLGGEGECAARDLGDDAERGVEEARSPELQISPRER